MFGPWAANQALSSGDILPEAIPFTQVLNMCGSSRESWIPSWFSSPPGTEDTRPRPQSALPHPNFSESSLLRLVISEFQEMFGAITSTRASRAAVIHWMPPP